MNRDSKTADTMLRRSIQDARREWDMQHELKPGDLEELIRDKFNGSENGFDAYMRERLMIRLETIIAAADLAPFMKECVTNAG